MCQHRCDKIGVMDLTTFEGVAAAQLDEPIPERRAVLEDGEAMRDCRGVGRRLGGGERLSPNLLPRQHGDIFAQDLSADRERLVHGQPGEGGPGLVTERRAAGRRVNENVGIDEAQRPSSS